jgi:hypothetical protein
VEESENYVTKRGANSCAYDYAVPKHRALVQELMCSDLSSDAKNLLLAAKISFGSTDAPSVAKH